MIHVIVEDRTFSKLIADTAAQEKQSVLFFKDEEELAKGLLIEKPELFLLDINVGFLDGPTWIEKRKNDPATRGIPIIVFGSSIRIDLLQDAQEAGADKVFPKAALMAQLPGLLRHYS